MTTVVPPEISNPTVKVVKIRGARKITGQRMRSSLQETAQVTLTRYADAADLLALAADMKSAAESGAPPVSMNDLLLYAVARALGRYPEVNATITEDEIRQYPSVDLGFAVDNGKSLLVPVIRSCHELSIFDVARCSRELIRRCREGQITLPELSGGTFTVSNLGSLGIHWFTPVLNTPQVAILGIGATHHVTPGGPALLPLSLTFDHQALDGMAAARALAGIAEAIQNVRGLSGLKTESPEPTI
ncbi:2-oxo acid dehydrogenase subunit E2 [Arthrobacter sp. AK01]|uniref:2-oxo acid dehydrogenase subunit E2 n=1 Tax=Micrococcaceae TaxID=1268 RepID=UPI001E645433|nr:MULTISPECIES: 2-oxo acid dehydrogenase subunit E2 [Micrococcaceae]MCD4852034.1 2-oxo acid dehydrogenase subunit E2 [Arthrobacter sp. AK01]MCP1413747.1 pyruvate/2-oxoglutarate dehydrogenase complex dihydrolipoamide acyltransferase (E2) component [Paenarthrobacter sp. A20]